MNITAISDNQLRALKEIRNHLNADIFSIDEDTAKENGFEFNSIALGYYVEILIETIENKEGK